VHYLRRPSHLSWFGHRNNRHYWVKYKNYRTPRYAVFSSCCYLAPFDSDILLSTLVSDIFNLILSLLWDTKFHTHKTTSKYIVFGILMTFLKAGGNAEGSYLPGSKLSPNLVFSWFSWVQFWCYRRSQLFELCDTFEVFFSYRHIVWWEDTNIYLVIPETAVFWGLTASIISVMMMQAVRPSETSVNSHQSTRRYKPKDSHLCTHRRENLKSYYFLRVCL
jgi:hypothetical protein